jgi:uncharacterized protein YbjT (DUF2867 family)
MRIAIVGGTGTLGRHVTAELAGRGHETRALSRSGAYPVDLRTGAGLAAALDGCNAVVDASNSQKKAAEVLVEGCRRLLGAEASAGVGHHLCVSIVGCDRVPMGYYRVKTEQEAVVARGPVPWTIVRATQFHELAAAALAAAGRWRLIPVPRLKLQTIAALDVARVLADAAEAPAAGARLQVAGPEILTARQLALAWRAATGSAALLAPVPLPGKLGRALRDGALTAGPDPEIRGTLTFADWLAARAEAQV